MKTLFNILLLGSLLLSAEVTSLQAAERPTNEYDANNCEFYVNGFVNSNGHYLWGWQYITSYIAVDAINLVQKQKGKILKVGILCNGTDIFLGQEIEPAYYSIKVDLKPLVSNGQGGYTPGPEYILKTFRYFMDVQRENGQVDRLWLKNAGKDFNWPQVYDNYPKSYVGMLGRGSVYAIKSDDPNLSPLFNQKKACEKKN
ncbi:MAG: hypothetical protein WCG27_02940 [Pseudomonadota bacterium]